MLYQILWKRLLILLFSIEIMDLDHFSNSFILAELSYGKQVHYASPLDRFHWLQDVVKGAE